MVFSDGGSVAGLAPRPAEKAGLGGVRREPDTGAAGLFGIILDALAHYIRSFPERYAVQ